MQQRKHGSFSTPLLLLPLSQLLKSNPQTKFLHQKSDSMIQLFIIRLSLQCTFPTYYSLEDVTIHPYTVQLQLYINQINEQLHAASIICRSASYGC